MRTRLKSDEKLREEIAHGWYYRTMTSKEIEARGIQMGNVYRWMAEYFGPGPRPPKGTVPPPKNGATLPPPKNGVAASKPVAAEPSTATPAVIQLRSLSKKKIRRGANGRYPDEVRIAVEPALLEEVSVAELAEQTGITPQTLNNWKQAARKRLRQERSESRALVVAPGKPVEPTKLATIRQAEILVNPDTTEQLLVSIRRSEGFVNLKKVVENRTAAFRAGLIEFDEDDHRLCMSYLQLAGGNVRGARK